MLTPNLGALRVVADRLDQLGLNYAFVGGSIVSFLLDDPTLSIARPTDDVDVLMEVVTAEPYSEVEARIRKLGFAHDTREDAPICRWVLNGLTVDIMPVRDTGFCLNTTWLAEALASAAEREIGYTRLRLISPAAFLATKYVAFLDRGKEDFQASHDLEDFITVIDGREAIVEEVNAAPSRLRTYVAESVDALCQNQRFQEALSGHLPGDSASQMRLPGLRQKLRGIAALTAI